MAIGPDDVVEVVAHAERGASPFEDDHLDVVVFVPSGGGVGILGPSTNSQLPGYVGHGLDRPVDLVLGVVGGDGKAHSAPR